MVMVAGCAKEDEADVIKEESREDLAGEMDADLTKEENDDLTEGIDDHLIEEVKDDLTEKTGADLEKEILAIEAEALTIQNKLQEAATQTDMNLISEEDYLLWDDELNSLWSRFSEAAPEDFKAVILEEQRAWIKNKEKEIEFAGSECEGGSIQPLIRNTKASELTRIRCYEMAGYLAEVTGQSFDLVIPEQAALDFVDRQGTTDTVYSELILEKPEGNDYSATIELYRLTTLEGKAVMQNDNVYEFQDEAFGVKGMIRVLDGGAWATFEITESDGNIVNAGDVFEFPERR